MKDFKRLFYYFNKISIKSYILILSFILIFIFLLLISYVSYITTTSIIMERIEGIDASNLRQVNNKISFSIGEMENLTKNISRTDILANYIIDYEIRRDDKFGRMTITDNIRSFLGQTMLPYDDIYAIEVYSGGAVFRSDLNSTSANISDIKDSDIYKVVKKSLNGNISIFDPYIKDSVFENGFSGITFGSIIYDNNNKEIGTIFIIMKPQWLNSMFENEKNLVITCKDNTKVLWSSYSDISLEHDKMQNLMLHQEGSFIYKDYKFFYTKTKYNDWMVITFKNILDVSKPVNIVRNYVFVAMFLSIIISFPVARLISLKITHPIFDLINAVRKYRAQDSFNYNPGSLKGVSLRKTFMSYFVFIATIPMFIYISMFYFTSSSVIEDKVKESFLVAFAQTTDNINSFISINERISVKIIIDDYIQDFLVSYNEGQLSDKNLNKNEIDKIVDESLLLGNNIFDMSIFGVDRETLFSTSYYESDEKMSDLLYSKVHYSYGDPIWLEYGVDRYKRDVVKLIRKIYSINDDRYAVKSIGYISMEYYETYIEELYRDLNLPDNNIYLIDNTGVIISHRTKALINQMSDYNPENFITSSGSLSLTKNDKKFLTFYASTSKLPWILVGEVDFREIKKDTNAILMVNIYTSIIMLLIALLLSYLFSRILTGSISKMKNKLVLLTDNNMEIDFVENMHLNEIFELGSAFNDMTSRINDLINTVYHSQLMAKDLENEKKDAELTALQAQINPHFFYNTIDAIKWMIYDGRKEAAAEMLTLLADLFRIGISREHRMITIEEEIKHAKAYIDIQKLRLNEKVEFWWSIDNRIFNFMTPKIILQPIIENAIMHGIQKNNLKGNISIFCYMHGESISFKVIDDGTGIENKELDKMRSALNGTLLGGSIGILNVQKRIRLFFGEEYGISIESSLGKGTIVKIVIPKITRDLE